MIFFEQNSENDQNNEINSENGQIEKDLFSCQNDLKTTKESLLRISADFDNYQRRIAKEKLNWITNSQIDIFTQLLPVIDDFDRAFANYKKDENKEKDTWLEGFDLIYKTFSKLLSKYNITEINIMEFDPELHEAIAQVESGDKTSGQIVEIVQKGYMIKDQLLRPAKVTVAK